MIKLLFILFSFLLHFATGTKQLPFYTPFSCYVCTDPNTPYTGLHLCDANHTGSLVPCPYWYKELDLRLKYHWACTVRQEIWPNRDEYYYKQCESLRNVENVKYPEPSCLHTKNAWPSFPDGSKYQVCVCFENDCNRKEGILGVGREYEIKKSWKKHPPTVPPTLPPKPISADNEPPEDIDMNSGASSWISPNFWFILILFLL